MQQHPETDVDLHVKTHLRSCTSVFSSVIIYNNPSRTIASKSLKRIHSMYTVIDESNSVAQTIPIQSKAYTTMNFPGMYTTKPQTVKLVCHTGSCYYITIQIWSVHRRSIDYLTVTRNQFCPFTLLHEVISLSSYVVYSTFSSHPNIKLIIMNAIITIFYLLVSVETQYESIIIPELIVPPTTTEMVSGKSSLVNQSISMLHTLCSWNKSVHFNHVVPM